MVENPSFISQKIDFREQPTQDDFTYHFVVSPGPYADIVYNTVLLPAFKEVRKRFGIIMQPLQWGKIPQINGEVPYVLVGPMNPLEMTREQERYFTRLSNLPEARINLVTAFPYTELGDSEEYRQKARFVIPQQDATLGINTIFADETDTQRGIRTVTARDVADNIVCETIRLKYEAVKDTSPQAQEALKEAKTLFAQPIVEMQQIYQEYGLWHRSPTDGMIAFRFVLQGKEYYFVSQTKTDKTTMDSDNFSVVTDISLEKNEVLFAGAKTPSSDVEFLQAVSELGCPMVAHFHHNDTTRGSKFKNLQTQKVIEYGDLASSRKIIQEVQQKNTNALLLKEHGWVWFGDIPKKFKEFVIKDIGVRASAAASS